jgi:hypothetical protein
MRAKDLQVRLPVVDRTTTAVAAARLIASDDLAALIVADDHGMPTAVIAAVDVLGLLVPEYVIEDIALAGVFDDRGSEEVWAKGARRDLGELLDDVGIRVHDILTVDSDATIVEVAARMVDAHAHIAYVADSSSQEPAFVLLPTVMDAILRFAASAESPA